MPISLNPLRWVGFTKKVEVSPDVPFKIVERQEDLNIRITREKIVHSIALLVLCGFFGMVATLLTAMIRGITVDSGLKDIVVLLIGQVSGGFFSVLSFYFGTTSSPTGNHGFSQPPTTTVQPTVAVSGTNTTVQATGGSPAVEVTGRTAIDSDFEATPAPTPAPTLESTPLATTKPRK